jgi:hypothetical protein
LWVTVVVTAAAAATALPEPAKAVAVPVAILEMAATVHLVALLRLVFQPVQALSALA